MASVTIGDRVDQFILNQVQDSIDTKKTFLADTEQMALIRQVADVCVKCYQNEGKTLLAGNGGSAADAQHISAEFVNHLNFPRPALSSLALTTDTSILTAVGNDSDYNQVFARQIEANARKGDVFIGISTSGNSKNVVEGLKQAQQQGVITVGFIGGSGGAMKDYCDYPIIVPSSFTPRIQECHILIGHIICDIIEQTLFAEKPSWS